MARAYLIFGTAICMLMAYANSLGWALGDTTSPGPRGPAARQGIYHK